MKRFLRNILYLSTKKYVNEKKLDVKNICIASSDLSYFNLSSNKIISFNYLDKLFYFRECPQRLSFDKFFQNTFDDFFSTINQVNISSSHFKQEIPIKTTFSADSVLTFKTYLEKKKSDRAFMKKIKKSDLTAEKIGFSIWENFEYNDHFFSSFGFNDLPDNCHDIAIYFICCMRNACAAYQTLKFTTGKIYSYFLAVRNKSSKIVADVLGIGEMITSADFCTISLDNKEIFGLMSESANGVRMLDTEIRLSGSLQRELIKLNILDYICFQPDHGPNNYNVCYNDASCKICAFDNDNPQTFLPIPFKKFSLSGCSPLISSEGYINRPYFDKKLSESILGLDIKFLEKELKPYLNVLQLFALRLRINNLKKAIVKTMDSTEKFLRDEDEWDEQSVLTELSGKYGKTYLLRAKEKNEEQS